MKTNAQPKNLLRSLVSALVCGLFLILAAGSLDLLIPLGIEVSGVRYPDGNCHVVETHANACQTISKYGKQDGYGRWHGWLSTKYIKHDTIIMYRERVYMVHGRRNGICTREYPDGRIEEEHYFGGIRVSEKKAASATAAEGSAFQLLENRYPWFLFMLEGFRFPKDYVEDYTDTLELLLGKYDFEPADFNIYYDLVQDSLEHTRFDSLMESTTVLTYSIGLGKAKDDELRLAVIDRYRSGGSTHSMLETMHPSYLNVMNDSGVDPTMLEVFCQDLDDTLDTYEPIDPADDYLVDSVDAYLYAALSALMSSEDTKSAVVMATDTTAAYVSELAVQLMLVRLLEGDLIRNAVYDRMRIGWGLASPPLAGTDLVSVTPSNARLKGHVMEDGGAAVTDRGMVWATHYNPTVNDQREAAGAGTGPFEVTINGLTEGQLYYARSYAINQAGTAYGNIISFRPENTVSSENQEQVYPGLLIYPNPASSRATIRLDATEVAAGAVVITDLSGRTVWQTKLPAGATGTVEIRADLEHLPEGMYHCMVKDASGTWAAGRLVIAR